MPLAAVSITPIGTGDTSVGRYVAAAHRALEELRERGAALEVELNAMSTLIAGDLDTLWQAIRVMHEAVFDAGAVRVSTLVKIDDRRDRPGTLRSKIDRVHELLRSAGSASSPQAGPPVPPGA